MSLFENLEWLAARDALRKLIDSGLDPESPAMEAARQRLKEASRYRPHAELLAARDNLQKLLALNPNAIAVGHPDGDAARERLKQAMIADRDAQLNPKHLTDTL